MNFDNSLKIHLERNTSEFGNIIDIPFNQNEVYVFDFTEKNKELESFDVDNVEEFTNYVNNKLLNNNCKIGAGGYLENRIIYKRSKHFGEGTNSRVFHLGVDIWGNSGTKILAPLDGKVHSFKINNNYGDYGATIILQHNINGITFYSLYGHLSYSSLNQKEKGMSIKKGEPFAEFGDKEENGHWSPHLHFQIMTTMLNNEGDFPGVASLEELDYYKSICPNPNYLLNIEALNKI